MQGDTGLAGEGGGDLRRHLRLREEGGPGRTAQLGHERRHVLRAGLGAGHRLHDARHLESVAGGKVEERAVEGDHAAARPRLRLARHLGVQRLDLSPQRVAALAVEGPALGVEAGECLHEDVHRALRARGVGPEVRVDERLRPDQAGRGEDRVHEGAELEDARLPGPGAPREPLGPGVEPEAHREDQARVGEADHVFRPRLVVVGVEAGGEDEPHVEPVAGHAACQVEDREDGRGYEAPFRRAVRAREGSEARSRGRHRSHHRRGAAEPPGRAAHPSHVVRPS